ncbi:MAG: DUF5908 family protein [Bacteroidia bacterium]
MPLEIRELVIRALVAPEPQQSMDDQASENAEHENAFRQAEEKRLILEIVQEMLEKKNER